MSSQPFFVKVYHLWKSKINCIYRGRFAEPANFCNVFWTTSHPRGSCNTQCQVVMWETGGEDFMMQRSLIVCKVCLPLSSVITLWRSAIFSSKLPPHFTSDIIWPLSSLPETILFWLFANTGHDCQSDEIQRHLEAERVEEHAVAAAPTTNAIKCVKERQPVSSKQDHFLYNLLLTQTNLTSI